jgi:hypothetical protein
MQDVNVVERRQSSSGVHRARSVRSSLRLIGTRWRTSTVTAANNSVRCRTAAASAANRSVACFSGNEDVSLQPTVETVRVPDIAEPTTHQSLPLVQPQQEQHKQQQKQRSSRASSWLTVLSNQNRKHLKSTSADVGKQKEHKSKATWILGFTYQKNKQGKSKPVCSESPENEETIEENHSSKTAWILGMTVGQEQQKECTASQVTVEQLEQHRRASADRLSSLRRMYVRQKSNSLSRCSSLNQQLLQQQEFLQQKEFLPMSSSVGTKRRNSMWALGSSKSSTLRSICGL